MQEIKRELSRRLQTRVCVHVCGQRGRGGKVYSAFALSCTNLQQFTLNISNDSSVYVCLSVCAFLSVRAGCNEVLDLGQERFRGLFIYFSLYFFFFL